MNHTQKAPMDGVKFNAGARNALDNAVEIPTDSGIFSRPEFMVLGLDGRIGNDRRTALSVLRTSSPSSLRCKKEDGYQTCNGVETMNHQKGNHARTLPITSGASTTNITQYQKAHECIARAKVLLTSGNAQLCLGQLQVASRALKQVCGGAA